MSACLLQMITSSKFNDSTTCSISCSDAFFLQLVIEFTAPSRLLSDRESQSRQHYSIDCVPGSVFQRFTPLRIILRPTLTLRDSINSSVPIWRCIHNHTTKIGTATFQLVSWLIEQLLIMSQSFLRFSSCLEEDQGFHLKYC